jgi:hypothetical protein
VKDPNWPKDPDEARRKAAIAKRKKENKVPLEATHPLPPGEVQQPGETVQNPSPSPLGLDKLTHLFGGEKAEAATFTGEPTRDVLTQPPPGYQTPSPNFVYGTGPKEKLKKDTSPAKDNEANPAQSKNGN